MSEENKEKQLPGLSEREARERRERGEYNGIPRQMTKSRGAIVRDNLCTLFNFLNFLIAGLLFAVGAYSNMLFIAIIILNFVIGIWQEFKAKKLVDELSLLNRPRVRIRRENQERTVDMEEIVKDDLLVLESGSQICNDAVVAEGTLEVNEALLTGESDAVVKEKGAFLLSGSFVTAGRAYARVVHVGEDNYAQKLAEEVKREKQAQSELMGSMKRVTGFTSFLILPLGVLLFLEALFLRAAPVDEAVVSSAAALLGMLPKGLALLISVSLAAGVIRLAKRKILVQNLYSLETLAHVDTLCLDKTGTLTDGNLKVRSILPLTILPHGEARRLASAYMAACEDQNATFRALKEAFKAEASYAPICKIPFSSRRKWGSVSFREAGTVFVGAPDRLMEEIPENLMREMEKGCRLVAVSRVDGDWKNREELPDRLQPLYAVVLEDAIRPRVKETLEFFQREGVEVKVISGDHVATVSRIAERAGLLNWQEAVDLSTIEGELDYDGLSRKYAVFARATPRQKQELVKALKRQNRQVAMTGDGVNDLLALREADCSIAVADGSDASRQISQVVLLDSDFTHLPQAVMEGRRVVHNVTRTAQVFFIKTIYSVLVSLFCLAANQAFPFIPIQITLVDAFIEAYPAFLSIMEADTERIEGRFLPTALRPAVPFGFTVTGMITVVSLSAPFSLPEKQTVMYLLLIWISMAAVVKSCIPFRLLRVFICVTMAGGILVVLVLLPSLFHVARVSMEMGVYLGAGAVLSLFCIDVADKSGQR